MNMTLEKYVTEQETAWTRDEFEAQLRAKGTAYHIHHPFNVKMNAGGCSREQVRGWVANRFYYQINIPLKDAAVMSNCPDRETRRFPLASHEEFPSSVPKPGLESRHLYTGHHMANKQVLAMLILGRKHVPSFDVV
jgi:coenzyme PQQ biosynthesis protein C